MKGICFKEPLFRAVVSGRKTVTRRLSDRYNVGEILYLKEPYRLETRNVIRYKYSSLNPDNGKWSNKLFMKEAYARYFIKITGKRQEHLQEITHNDCIKEGIVVVNVFNARQQFAKLIDEINGAGTWDSNPIVTRYEFKLVDL